jgi:hypothetical protein
MRHCARFTKTMTMLAVLSGVSPGGERIDAALAKGSYGLSGLERLGSLACEKDLFCDRTTGCVAPRRPQGPLLKILPDDRAYRQYLRDLQTFQTCRRLSLISRSDDAGSVRFADLRSVGLEEITFAQTIDRWNGAYIWAPASASMDTITRFGDEVRAVFGDIPEGDCSDEASKTIPVQIDGNIVDLKPNVEKEGHPLEFEHRDTAGHVVKWTSDIARCDKPSLAGSASYCGINSRLTRQEKGDVEWLFFCRKSGPGGEVQPTPYWQRSNPKFALFGVIGFNRLTGEIAFFDGRKDREEFDWSARFVPPGGRSYGDHKGRAAAEAFYDPTFQVECSACHDNKGPHVITPNIHQARVGFSGPTDPRAIAFSLDTLLPPLPRTRSTPFRVIGSAYTGTHRISLSRAMTVRDPTGNCTGCHTLTTQVTGQRFAADAVALAPTIQQPDRSQYLQLAAERRKLLEIDTHRTTWATRSGSGRIHPWMAPIDGSEISSSDWDVLSNCLWGAGGSECDYRPLYTSCPRPGAAEDGDMSEPSGLTANVLPVVLPAMLGSRVLRLEWEYRNSYGNVPERDDVRFNVAIRATDIPAVNTSPARDDYPPIEEALDTGFVEITDKTGVSGKSLVIRDVSYLGHARFTDPVPSTQPRSFRLDVPARCDRRYLVRIVPKRYCFDQQMQVFGRADYLAFVDIPCPRP